jgi:hypothetical protein
MQDQRDARQAVRHGVLADPPRGQLSDLRRHRARLVAPGLVRHFVHVAVVTRKIASAADLDDELAERKRQPSHREQGGNVKACGPLKPGQTSHERITALRTLVAHRPANRCW